MITKKRLTKQMMTLICSVTLAACGQAPTVQTNSEYEVMGITTSDRELDVYKRQALKTTVILLCAA